MNWVVVGLGGAGKGHAKQVKETEGMTLAGVFDVSRELCEAKAKELGVKPYDSLEALADDRSVDGASIATPSAMHAPVAMKLLEAGKHVLVEKPFALDGAEARAIAEAAARSKHLALPFHNRRWDPDFRLVLDVVKSGVLGDVKVVRSTVGGPGRDSGWRLLKKFGGGRLNDWGPHLFSQVYEWFSDKPLSLAGYTCRAYPDTECEDLFAADFLFTPDVRVSVMMSGFSHIPSPRWEVLGAEGTLQLTGNIHGEFALHWKRRDGQESQKTYRRQEVAPPVPIYPAIVEYARTGAQPPVSVNEGIVVSQWLEKVRESARGR